MSGPSITREHGESGGQTPVAKSDESERHTKAYGRAKRMRVNPSDSDSKHKTTRFGLPPKTCVNGGGRCIRYRNLVRAFIHRLFAVNRDASCNFKPRVRAQKTMHLHPRASGLFNNIEPSFCRPPNTHTDGCLFADPSFSIDNHRIEKKKARSFDVNTIRISSVTAFCLRGPLRFATLVSQFNSLSAPPRRFGCGVGLFRLGLRF